jgi:alpha-beta hydrolase superfamily lysophospholipase
VKRDFLLGLVAGALGGVAAQRYLTPKPLPSTPTVWAWYDQLADTFDAAEARKRLQSDWTLRDGLRLHLDVLTGEAGAPTAIVLPGTGVYAALLMGVMAALNEAGLNVVGVDFRGHGQSEGRRGSYTIAEMVRDASAVVTYAVERFGPRIGVTGVSQGGLVTLYAGAADERIGSLAPFNIAILDEPQVFEISRAPALFRTLYPVLSLLASVVPELPVSVWTYLDPVDLGRAAAFDSVERFFQRDPLAIDKISLKALASLASTPLARPLEAITTPTLVLQAEKDALFRLDYVRGLYERMTCRKEFVVVPGCNHMQIYERAGDWGPQVARWFYDTL